MYKRKNRAKYSLKAHLVFVCKYRKKLLRGDFDKDIRQWIYSICSRMDTELHETESDRDHIHLLISYNVTDRICDIVKRIKQETVYKAWAKYPSYLKKYFRKEKTLWSDGYFAGSIGEVSEETIRQYIKNQG